MRDPLGQNSPESVRAALTRVLASESFLASESLSRFLRHLAERTLEGRTEVLKEYTLGVDVLRRPESFDPRLDSIVRVEASRLRKRLAAYYETAGARDPIRIELPPGSYVPTFRLAKSAAQQSNRSSFRRASAAAVSTLVLAAGTWLIYRAAPSWGTNRSPKVTTLAVLPFANLSGNSEDDRLADSITSETIALLARVEGLRIIARSSALQYKGRNVDVRQAGRDLNVSAVAEGTIRRKGHRIRVTAHLANTGDGFQRWQRTWEISAGDALRVHEEIARGIARTLEAPPPGEGRLFRSRTTREPEAYRLVLQARYLTPTTPANAAVRIDLYRRAIERDPGYAATWLGMADTWARLANAAEAAPHQVMPPARQAVLKALELDPALPDAHLLAANISWSYEWDWTAADREFRRALQLDPDSGTIRNFYAQYLVHMGRFADALQQVDALRSLEPLAPDSRTIEANVLFLSGQHERTIRLCEELLHSDPRLWGVRYWLGRAYEAVGRRGEALQILESLHPAGAPGGRGFGVLGALYAKTGRRADAEALLARVLNRAKTAYVSPVSVAQMHIGLGDYDNAFDWLEKAYRERDGTMPHSESSLRLTRSAGTRDSYRSRDG